MRKNFEIFSKKGTSLILILALIIAYFVPIVPVIAASSTTTLSVTFRGDNASYGKVQYSLDDGTHWDDVTEDTSNLNISVSGDNLRLKIIPNENYSVDYAGIGLNLDGTVNSQLSDYGLESDKGYSVPANIQSVALEQVEFRHEEGGNSGQQNGSNVVGKITLNLSGEELEYNAPWSEDASDFVFGINNSEMKRLSKDDVNFIKENNEIVGLETKNAIDYAYNYNNEGTVTFNIKTQWDDLITSLKINGVSYNTPQTKNALINAFNANFRGIRFDIENVPYSETYDIEVVGRKQNDDEKIMGNFGWSYDPNSNEYSDDDKIPYGNLEFVKAVYNGVTYNSPEEVNAVGGVFEWKNAIKGLDSFGEAMFPTGTELTIRLIPDAGYQLTSFDLNGFPFEAGEEVGLYTFTIGGGNWHLGAHFTEVSDEVQANSQNIKSGNIDINKSENENLGNGTAKLEVNDVVGMSQNRIEEFENTASEEGYELENYLDISLYNTIYKGGNRDANGNYESWDTPVENIDDEATITLELENDMSGKELAIIHEKHDGNTITGYELIDVTYNEENNTIIFETDSFSNYAIVSKEKTEIQPQHKKYIVNSITNSGDSISFTALDGSFYSFYIKDRKDTTDEELQQIVDLMDDPEFTFEVLKKHLNKCIAYGKSAAGDGTLLKLYEMYLYDNGVEINEVDGGFKLKLKITDDMKGYDSYKLVYIADDGTIEKNIELTKNGEYLEGTLPHLSMYALVGNKSETATTDTNTTTDETATTTSNNPKTGDNIITIFSIFAISTLGTFITIKHNRNRKTRKH